jgi:site-specific DNA-cytosine methylase
MRRARPWTIGTDCSGAEAPIWAAKAFKFEVIHEFSCDCAGHAKVFIQLNAKPREYFDDMVGRRHEDLPSVQIYVIGFPCKPFSRLHHRSKLLAEREAKPFFAMLLTLKTKKPPLAILENVQGISQCIAKVLKHVRKELSGLFLVFIRKVDPQDIGEPVRRPRFYFICIRFDVAIAPPQAMSELVDRVLQEFATRSAAGRKDIASRMLLNSSAEVIASRNQQQARFQQAKDRGFPPSARDGGKWHEYQKAFDKKHRLPNQKSFGPADDMLLTTPRSRALWVSMTLRYPGQDIAVDCSQNIGRGSAGLENGEDTHAGREAPRASSSPPYLRLAGRAFRRASGIFGREYDALQSRRLGNGHRRVPRRLGEPAFRHRPCPCRECSHVSFRRLAMDQEVDEGHEQGS